MEKMIWFVNKYYYSNNNIEMIVDDKNEIEENPGKCKIQITLSKSGEVHSAIT